MEISGVDRAVERFTSIEFQNLLNQDYNNAFFIQRIEIGALRKRLAKNLKHYIFNGLIEALGESQRGGRTHAGASAL